ncbi:Hypothetical predicted protein [Pelobates cultripes]|uniref:Uncharacterized protein n=1 Tax=Pelobates cultripes TaxID=61616 RepID=A0AAD1RYK5_PELCU|nr:Hypothetical predicted protein [Pelobates cultripes]
MTKALRTSIGNDKQLLRADLHGLTDHVAHVEADHDNLMAAQAATTSTLEFQTSQLQHMVLHIEDLDNRVAQKIRYRWIFPMGLAISRPEGPRPVRYQRDLMAISGYLQLPPINMRWPDPLDFYRLTPEPPEQALPLWRNRNRMKSMQPAGAQN